MKSILRSRFFQIGIVMALVAALVCGIALPAMAEDGGTSSPTASNAAQINIVKGKVTTIAADKTSFEIQPQEGSPVTITVDSNTKYYKINAAAAAAAVIKDKIQNNIQDKKAQLRDNIQNRINERGLGNKNGQIDQSAANAANTDATVDAEETPAMEQGLTANVQSPQGFFARVKSWFNRGPKFGQDANFEDIQVGDGIVARVMPNENLAKQVLIVKPSNIKTVRGNITVIGSDSFTITTTATPPEAVTLTWDDNTRFVIKGSITLKIDQYATAIYKVDGANNIAQIVNVLPTAPTPEASPSTTATTTAGSDGTY